MTTQQMSLITSMGSYTYDVFGDLTRITFVPSVIWNKRRKNEQRIVGPVATMVSNEHATDHYNQTEADRIC